MEEDSLNYRRIDSSIPCIYMCVCVCNEYKEKGMRNSGIGHAGWEPIGYRDIRWQKPINWNIVPKIVFYDIGKRKYNVALLAGWSLINNCLLEWQVEYRILTLEMCRVLASLFFFFIFSFSEKRGWPFIFRPSNVSNVFLKSLIYKIKGENFEVNII